MESKAAVQETEASTSDSKMTPIEELYNLTRAETSYIVSIASQMRSEPGVLRSMVESEVYNRLEFIPDLDGNAPDVVQMSKNADFLAHQVRYTIHNTLLELGQWSLVSHFLEQIVQIDKSPSNKTKQRERAFIVVRAMDMLDQSMGIVGRRLKRGILGHERFAGIWKRAFSFEQKWTGARILTMNNAASGALEDAPTLAGSLYRFAKWDWRLDTTAELVKVFSRTSLQDLEWLGEDLVDCISELKGFYDFYQLLSPYVQPDVPLQHPKASYQFKENSEKAQKILDSAAIERYLKSIDSLSQEGSFQKIWNEIDLRTSKTCGGKTLNELIGYRKIPPRWYTPPRTRSIPIESPAPARSRSCPQTPDPKVRQSHITEHAPVKLTPVSYLTDVQLFSIDFTPARVGRKVKRTGVASSSKAPAGQVSNPETPPQSSETVVFHVNRSIYDIFERIFEHKTKGPVDQDEFIKAMIYLGFKLTESAGSRYTLIPPAGNVPIKFKDHRLHNGKSEWQDWQRLSCKKRLQNEYGWALSSFCTP